MVYFQTAKNIQIALEDYLEFIGLKYKSLDINRFVFFILFSQPVYLFLFLLDKPSINLSINLISKQLVVSTLEELLFRGILLGFFMLYLTKKCCRTDFANIAAAFVFALSHIFSHTSIWAFATFFPALIFGYLRQKQGLTSAVLLHFLYNVEYFMFF